MTELADRRIALVLGPSTGGIGRHVATLRDALRRVGAVPVAIGPADVLQRFDFGDDGRACQTQRLAGARGLGAALRDIDLVHAHGLRPAAAAALARPSAPLVVTWHNAVLGGFSYRCRAFPAQRLAARRADVSLCVSPDLVERVFQLGGSPRLAPVGAAPLRPSGRPSAQVRAELRADGRALVVCVARLHHQKGLDVLIEAMAQLADHPRRPLLVLAGDGPDRPALKTQIEDTGAPVRLLGVRADVADLLAAADLAVLPSRWEGSPLAAHEALAAGTPLIASAVGGVPLLVGDGGSLIPPQNVPALVAAIRFLLEEPARAGELAQRGRIRAAAWPDAQACARAVLAVYAELLDRQ